MGTWLVRCISPSHLRSFDCWEVSFFHSEDGEQDVSLIYAYGMMHGANPS